MSQTPAGWYPSEGQERYWDGERWTEQTRPLAAGSNAPPSSVPTMTYPPAAATKKKHTVRNVLLVLVLLMVLFVGGCFALFGAVLNEADKAIDEEAKNDKPVTVEEGAAFDHDGFAVAKGWKIAPEEFGGATVTGLRVTLEDDQDVTGGGRSALLTFRLYDGKAVVSEILCNSNEMQEGESSKMSCSSLDTEKLGKYDTIRVADTW